MAYQSARPAAAQGTRQRSVGLGTDPDKGSESRRYTSSRLFAGRRKEGGAGRGTTTWQTWSGSEPDIWLGQTWARTRSLPPLVHLNSASSGRLVGRCISKNNTLLEYSIEIVSGMSTQ